MHSPQATGSQLDIHLQIHTIPTDIHSHPHQHSQSALVAPNQQSETVLERFLNQSFKLPLRKCVWKV